MILQINDKIKIDQNYLSFKFSRSSGPGGQNVNKVNTRVELFFDFDNCDNLSDFQKQRIRTKLKKRISSDGLLRFVCQQFRTQSANKNGALNILQETLSQALKPLPKRKKTRPTLGSKIKRLEDKAHRAKIKKLRSKKITQQ